MSDTNRKIVVKVNQQQRELLEHLRDEGGFGDTLDKVILNLFRAHVKESNEAGE